MWGKPFKRLPVPPAGKRGNAIDRVEEWFQEYFGVRTAVSFDSGRSALYAILEAFGIGHGDDVVVQAFTCVAVPNSVRWTGARPVYVDVDQSFNIDPNDLQKKITNHTKAMIIQHTFGIPAAMGALLRIARAHNIIVIEDCAHSLGAFYENQKVGSLGGRGVFSFGRDKVLSSVWGGMAIMSPKLKVESKKLRQIQGKLPYPSRAWIAQQLFHPIAFAVILPLYTVIIGKVMLECFKRLGLLSKPVDRKELVGAKPSCMPRRYPNALARLLVRQLSKLKRYNAIRRRTVSYYREALQSRKDITLPNNSREVCIYGFQLLFVIKRRLFGAQNSTVSFWETGITMLSIRPWWIWRPLGMSVDRVRMRKLSPCVS